LKVAYWEHRLVSLKLVSQWVKLSAAELVASKVVLLAETMADASECDSAAMKVVAKVAERVES
jgi:hypothetical protein